ncbi:MAG: hypothetical protein BWY06_01267 [Candidatus Latescibacteria bacterium ADurb.Bin168]|nr:MAG: hypothetical protein BWY06_01267 [Candidatus Latescibacteria bacterium ADurb.Bin168]
MLFRHLRDDVVATNVGDGACPWRGLFFRPLLTGHCGFGFTDGDRFLRFFLNRRLEYGGGNHFVQRSRLRFLLFLALTLSFFDYEIRQEICRDVGFLEAGKRFLLGGGCFRRWWSGFRLRRSLFRGRRRRRSARKHCPEEVEVMCRHHPREARNQIRRDLSSLDRRAFCGLSRGLFRNSRRRRGRRWFRNRSRRRRRGGCGSWRLRNGFYRGACLFFTLAPERRQRVINRVEFLFRRRLDGRGNYFGTRFRRGWFR